MVTFLDLHYCKKCNLKKLFMLMSRSPPSAYTSMFAYHCKEFLFLQPDVPNEFIITLNQCQKLFAQ